MTVVWTINPSDYLDSLPAEVETAENVADTLDELRPLKTSWPDQGWPSILAQGAWIIEAARCLDVIDLAAARLKQVREEVAVLLARQVPFQTSLVVIPGCPPMEPRFSKDRKAWKNEALLTDVRPRVLMDPESGEVLDGPAVFERTLEVVSLIGSNVKTTGLKKLGLDPADYCTEEPKDPTVTVIR